MADGPGFLARLRENGRRLKAGRAGTRFLDCFHYKQELRDKHGPIYRRIDIALGLTIAVIGLIMVPAPGPGWIIVFIGMALLAGESEKVAKLMDRGEQFLRRMRAKSKRFWRRASLAMKSSITIAAGALVSVIAYGLYIFVISAFFHRGS
jgi:uncharacterized protein (TIGR02611 family)